MIKTYFKTAIRKIFKQPFYSTLNITAVTLSMSISLLILFIIFNQFDYDSANRRKDRIFRINTRVTTTNGDEAQFATIPYAAKDLLDSAVFESWVSLIALQSKSMGYGSKRFTVSGAIVTGNYFEMFNFPIISGSWGTSFSNASEVALSKHTSLKMFNTVDCIGRIIEIEGVGSFMVSAIYNDLDTKSHISNDFILSYSIIPSLFAKGSLDSNLSNINNYTSSYLYTLANRELSKNEINNVTKEMSSLAMSEFRPKNKEKEIAFFAQLLSNISPSRDLWLENSKALSFSTISIFSLIVFALVLLTALNYSSVMIALGLSRSKEIGIRKIVGAKRSHVFFQFIIEAIVIALISLFFALLLCPIIASFAPFQRLFVDTTFHVSIIPYAILFAVFIGLIAGAFPAAILSAYKEINMLHNLLNKVVLRGLSFRKAIIVLQFSVSYGLILFVFVLFRQTEYMSKSDYGFSYKDVVSIQVNDFREQIIVRDEIGKMPEVLSVSGISTNLGYMPTEQFEAWKGQKSEKFSLACYYVDNNVIKDLGLTLLAGANFSLNSGSNDNLVLINETGYKQLKIGSVNEAIGQQFFLNDSTPCQVLGVIKDFHFQNFKRSIGPMIFRYDLEKLAFINARVHSSQIDVFTDKLTANSMVKKLGYPVDYILWDVTYRELQSHEGDVLTVTFFTLTFLIIGCLGLIGIVTYSTNQRIKEITVRKILGANALQIFSVLTKEYFLLILISLLVGLPLGYMLSREYLNEYTYRINIDLPLIFFTFIVISLIGLVILGSVTLKNCVAKPINNLNR